MSQVGAYECARDTCTTTLPGGGRPRMLRDRERSRTAEICTELSYIDHYLLPEIQRHFFARFYRIFWQNTTRAFTKLSPNLTRDSPTYRRDFTENPPNFRMLTKCDSRIHETFAKFTRDSPRYRRDFLGNGKNTWDAYGSHIHLRWNFQKSKRHPSFQQVWHRYFPGSFTSDEMWDS